MSPLGDPTTLLWCNRCRRRTQVALLVEPGSGGHRARCLECDHVEAVMGLVPGLDGFFWGVGLGARGTFLEHEWRRHTDGYLYRTCNPRSKQKRRLTALATLTPGEPEHRHPRCQGCVQRSLKRRRQEAPA